MSKPSPLVPAGNQPSITANTNMKSIPVQKVGVEIPNAAMTLATKSKKLPLLTADITPMGMPIKVASKKPIAANSKV